LKVRGLRPKAKLKNSFSLLLLVPRTSNPEPFAYSAVTRDEGSAADGRFPVAYGELFEPPYETGAFAQSSMRSLSPSVYPPECLP
jgi:hypothetical protein